MNPTDKRMMRDFLGDKRIAIVGNATSLLTESYGEEIDDHDIVVRMNRAAAMLGQYRSALGRKTTILTAARDVEMSGLKDVEIILWLTSKDEFDTRGQCFRDTGKPVLFYSQEARWSLAKNALDECKPTSGAMTLDWFDSIDWPEDEREPDENMNPAKNPRINVYGFDFFASESVVTGQNNAKKWGHNPEAERLYAENLYNFRFVFPKIR